MTSVTAGAAGPRKLLPDSELWDIQRAWYESSALEAYKTTAVQVHGKAESISLHNIFGFLRGGFLWSKATNSLANVCNAETGQVCTGFLEHEGDAHWKRLQSPIASSPNMESSMFSEPSTSAQ